MSMGRNRRRKKTSATMAVARPVLILAGGVVAAVAIWQVLMRDGEPFAVRDEARTERLSQHDRQALDRILHEARTGRSAR